jgi:alpha-tubulin N-acetyltransferase 1
VITTTDKLSYAQGEQKLYIKVEGNKALGFIKIGNKSLFINQGKMVNINPRCVLDFYVHESMQRRGLGLELMQTVLEHENLKPAKMAYDRPSNKLLGFLRKHFCLSNYTPQSNNFVVY